MRASEKRLAASSLAALIVAVLRYLTRFLFILTLAFFASGEASALMHIRAPQNELAGQKTASGIFSETIAMLRHAAASQAVELQQEKTSRSYDFAPASPLAAERGAVSLYDDATKAASRYANRATDVSKASFEKNLVDSGWARSVSKDGKTIILQKDGAKYVLRDGAKSTGGPTADYYKSGSQRIDLKIRLESGGAP